MSTPVTEPSVSPYLLRPRRGLYAACREICARRGLAPPCATCDMAHLCGAPDAPRPVASHRVTRLWRRCGDALIRIRTR